MNWSTIKEFLQAYGIQLLKSVFVGVEFEQFGYTTNKSVVPRLVPFLYSEVCLLSLYVFLYLFSVALLAG